jgi:hypothetical protein
VLRRSLARYIHRCLLENLVFLQAVNTLYDVISHRGGGNLVMDPWFLLATTLKGRVFL